MREWTTSPGTLTVLIALACGCSSAGSGYTEAPGASGGAANGCPVGQIVCGTECVSIDSDPSHCGQCGSACGAGQSCVAGACTCPAGSAPCAGTCVNVLADNANCGGCGMACPAGSSCQNGACSCQAGLMSCSGRCVNLMSDGNNCGACGTVCTAGQVCSQGLCGSSCSVLGQVACGTSCVDLMSDVANCGVCGMMCQAGQTCSGGACSCPVGQALCNGACADVLTSSSNCGACGVLCAGGQSCQNGLCTCPAGQQLCGGQCVDTTANPSNCGSCGVVCGAGQSCVAGACAGGLVGTGGAGGTGGVATGGVLATGGVSTGGVSTGGVSTGGVSTGGVSTGGVSTGGVSTGGAATTDCDLFSFFVTSLAAMRRESGSQDGFGGDLGGLAGADALCQKIATTSLACAGQKTWRAFLSTSTEDAIDRVGEGPWYDRLGRIVAENTAALQNTRPEGADSAIINDLPNEDGVPNHDPDGTGEVDNHDVLTGSTTEGRYESGANCSDWTSIGSGQPRIGHMWPRSTGGQGAHWISDHTVTGCAPGVNLSMTMSTGNCVGCMGGYGAIYCMALTP